MDGGVGMGIGGGVGVGMDGGGDLWWCGDGWWLGCAGMGMSGDVGWVTWEWVVMWVG